MAFSPCSQFIYIFFHYSWLICLLPLAFTISICICYIPPLFLTIYKKFHRIPLSLIYTSFRNFSISFGSLRPWRWQLRCIASEYIKGVVSGTEISSRWNKKMARIIRCSIYCSSTIVAIGTSNRSDWFENARHGYFTRSAFLNHLAAETKTAIIDW